MDIRHVLVGLVLAACGTPEATKPQGAPARAEPTSPSPTPVAEPVSPSAVGAPGAPKDKPVHTSTAAAAAELARAIAP